MAIDVSVIVPIYNMENFVEAGVKALLNQRDVNCEFIFVDDGSKDKSGERIADLIRGDARARLIRTENRGSGPARNTGIDAAAGEYLYFFDIDDTMEPDALSRMVALARKYACELLVFGFTRRYDESETPKVVPFTTLSVTGEEARAHYDKYMQGETCVQGAPWNKLFRRDVTVSNNVRYPALRRNQDEVFIMRYAACAKTIQIVPDVLYHHLSNTQERMWLKYRLEYAQNVEELFDFYDGGILKWNARNEGVKRNLSRMYFLCCLDAMKVLFNPKWNLKFFDRYARLSAILASYRARAKKYETAEPDQRLVQSNFYPYLKKKSPLMVYLALYARTRRK